jgi:hypothetical protein
MPHSTISLHTHDHLTAHTHQQHSILDGAGVRRDAAQVQQDEGGAENEGGFRGVREGGGTGRGRGRGVVEPHWNSSVTDGFQAVLTRSA